MGIGVFQRQNPADRMVDLGAGHGPPHLLRVQDSPVCVYGQKRQAPQGRGRRALLAVKMSAAVADHLFTLAGQKAQAYLVCHGSAGDKQRRLLAQKLRAFFLQPPYGGVFAVSVVAHLRLVHGLSHAGAGSGYSVASQVNRFHMAPVFGECPPRGKARGVKSLRVVQTARQTLRTPASNQGSGSPTISMRRPLFCQPKGQGNSTIKDSSPSGQPTFMSFATRAMKPSAAAPARQEPKSEALATLR